jgi:tetratricopeptide (TPR) repeat protein
MEFLRSASFFRNLVGLFSILIFGCSQKAKEMNPAFEIGEIAIAMRDGNYALAETKIDSFESQMPLPARLFLFRGICESVEEDSKAIQDFTTALSVCHKDSCKLRQEIYENRALIYRFQSPNYRMNSLEDYLQAHKIAINCPLATNWDSITNAFNASIIASGLKQWALADSLSIYLKSNFPNQSDGYIARATIFQDQEKIELAILEYDTLIGKHESNNDIHNIRFELLSRADLYHKKGDLPAACADWQKALDLGLEDAQPKLDSFCLKK